MTWACLFRPWGWSSYSKGKLILLSLWRVSALLSRVPLCIWLLLCVWLLTWSLNLRLFSLLLLSLSLTASKDICKNIRHPCISWLFFFLSNIHHSNFWCFVIAKFLFRLFHSLVKLTLWLLEIFFFIYWGSVSWVNERMENWDLAWTLSLDEGEKFSFLYFWIDKCLSHVVTVFKEVNNAPISVNKHSNNWSFSKMSKLWLFIWLNSIIIFPSPLSKYISSCQINAINFFRCWQISFKSKTLPSYSNIDFWKIVALLKRIHSPLEVKHFGHIL